MPVTQASTLSTQFQTYFSKKLLTQVKQLTILDQFARKEPVPRNAGALGNAQKLRIQRYGAPSISGVKAATEGTALAAADYRQLSLISLEKGVNQYQQVIGLTDILQMTALFNTLEQAQKTQSADIALWIDSLIRNVLIGSNLAASGASIGAAIESPIDNSDAIDVVTGSGGVKMYGNPGSGLTQSMTGLNTSTNTAQVHLDSSGVLDAVTRLRLNRAPLINGRYVMVTDPRIARDLQRDTQWLAASNYGNQGKPFYNGEVGEIAGCKVVTQTNSFVCRNTAEFVYSNPTGGGTAAGTDIIASFFLGDEAFGIPYLTGDDPMSPRMYIVDTPDKSDPTNQLTTVGVKLFFQALRLAAGNTASSGNPTWYICHRSKTASQG
jgi:N4-gp56 family major capsid protein